MHILLSVELEEYAEVEEEDENKEVEVMRYRGKCNVYRIKKGQEGNLR